MRILLSKLSLVYLLAVVWLLLPLKLAFATAHYDFEKGACYQICFTPGEDCTAVIVAAINNARQSILIQAYNFTSMPIAKALVMAKRRGVALKVILDSSQEKKRYSAVKFLLNQGVPTWIDDKVMIAHNKVMIIDEHKVITGSFNFTRAAQFDNAENVLLISDKQLAAKYKANWCRRMQSSRQAEAIGSTGYDGQKIRINQGLLQRFIRDVQHLLN